MDPTILVAIITAVGGVIVAIIGARRLIEERLAEADMRLSILETKLDLVWDIYVERALEASRKAGLTVKNSPLQPSLRWREKIGNGLAAEIEHEVNSMLNRGLPIYDIVVFVYATHRDRIDALGFDRLAIIGLLLQVAQGSIGKKKNNVNKPIAISRSG